MRIGAAALAGGIFGIVGTLCFLVAFSTDYWLVARENCGSFLQPTKITPTQDKDANRTQIQFDEAATTSWPIVHHEGFFWRCMFAAEPSTQAVLVTFFTNQPGFKMCIHGYLFPLPVALGEVPDPIYDATAVFRGFWTVLIIVGLVSALTGGLLLVCGAPFISNKLYKLGGAFFIAAAISCSFRSRDKTHTQHKEQQMSLLFFISVTTAEPACSCSCFCSSSCGWRWWM
ncbi:transmembrane protein 182-like isoform X2 [Girardinichthys multiradiatus]|uniref:transmembrane protein 182-like isoform X2 n=1 Tax=Girardinichthys multiradiatus TaxID=208333 RepID=UPI001FABA819|nr:transmembrane protein 182-like isoform X2 [Girardinichthys multiradiatus]